MYHSWWFITILALIAINIVFCAFSKKEEG
ncbi:MAG: cytochrome c biogenesis protein ResB [bacterium]